VPPFALFLTGMTAELAMFAAAGFLLFALDDLAVDILYFLRSGWRTLGVYSRFPRAFAGTLPAPTRPGWMAVFIPAWDEAAVIAPMLRSTLERFGDGDYRLFVGHYRNDPATRAAIDSVPDPRVVAVEVDVDGPTTKADCLNRIYGIM
jgi:adsorption protein B